MPALAFYQTLREENDDQEAALTEVDRILTALVERSGRRRLVQIWDAYPIRSRPCGSSIAGR